MSNQRIGRFPYGELERAMRFYMHGGRKPAPVLFLKFGEGSGTSAKDSSPEGNDGTLDGPTWTTGIKGKALSFDGDNDVVTVAHDSSLDISTLFSIAIWAKLTSALKGDLLEKGAYNAGWDLAHAIENCINLRSTGFDVTTDHSVEIFTLNAWTFIVITYDEDAGDDNLKAYKNGALLETWTETGGLTTSETSLKVGRAVTEALSYFEGVLDELRIYNVALTADEIRQLYYGID